MTASQSVILMAQINEQTFGATVLMSFWFFLLLGRKWSFPHQALWAAQTHFPQVHFPFPTSCEWSLCSKRPLHSLLLHWCTMGKDDQGRVIWWLKAPMTNETMVSFPEFSCYQGMHGYNSYFFPTLGRIFWGLRLIFSSFFVRMITTGKLMT